IHDNVTLADQNHQLTQLNGRLNCGDARKVTDAEYCRPTVCSDGSIVFTNMKLQNDGNVRIVFFIFSQYSTKGPIELDTTVGEICSRYMFKLDPSEDL
ncbi:hypothetical protein A2U01_0035105, partial [Trifolium medium]|nr:hypothetical protein [Trifolium medium]